MNTNSREAARAAQAETSGGQTMITLQKIRAHQPCRNGWEKLLRHLGKTTADDEPLSIATVLESNKLEDALWCLRAVEGHDREIRLYAVWCVRRVQHLMTDPLSVTVLDVAERFANGQASDEELSAAEAAKAAERAAQAVELRRICREMAAGRDPYPEEDGR